MQGKIDLSSSGMMVSQQRRVGRKLGSVVGHRQRFIGRFWCGLIDLMPRDDNGLADTATAILVDEAKVSDVGEVDLFVATSFVSKKGMTPTPMPPSSWHLRGNVTWDRIQVLSIWDRPIASDFGHRL
nr:hypothetical protein CFP56_65630 [Quercus suber]